MFRQLIAGVLTVALAGGVVRADVDIPVKDLPAAVVKAINDRFPNAELIEAERDDDGDNGKPEYEVKIKAADGKRYEIEVTPEGKIIDVDKDD